MSTFGITLLIIGVIIFVISFIIPDKDERLSRREKEKQLEKQQEEIRRMMDNELVSMRLRLNEASNETVESEMVNVERTINKTVNEKMIEINDYAVTIIDEMDNRHKEVMFLYDMLNEKKVDVQNTVRQAEAAAKEANDAAKSVQESYDAAQQEYERQISEQAVFVNSMNDMAFQDEPVMYHGQIDESIFENMARNDVFVTNTVSEPIQKQEITSLFNTAIANGTIPEYENEISVEQIKRTQEEPVAVENDDYREAAFSGEGNNNQKILALYGQGMDVVDIARELNLGVGEVKLVIDLYK